MKKLLAILILASFTTAAWTEEIKAHSLSNQADDVCLHGQQESYKLIPLDTQSQLVSPEVWEAYNQVVTEHGEKKDILYPEAGQQQQRLSCHNLMMEKLSNMDLDY